LRSTRESVIVQAEAQHFADQQQQQDEIKKNRKSIVLRAQPVGKIAQPSRPARNQQNDQKCQTHDEVGDSQPPPRAVVALGLGESAGAGVELATKVHVS
jgi:hypothetical protein